MANVNLKLLQTFLLAVEHGSFRRAAEESNRSASAVSMQIRDLEEQVGVSLFFRTPQRARLTPEGRLLFAQVSKSMSDVEASLDHLSLVAAQRKDKIRIACAPTLAAGRIAEVLASLKLRFPRSKVEVTEIPPRGALPLLQQQEVEFYIGPEIPHLADFVFDKIIDDPLFACVPDGLYDGETSLPLAVLGAYPLILLDGSTAVRGLLNRMAMEEGIALQVEYEVMSAQTALAFASAGLGVCVVPGIAISARLWSSLNFVRIDHPQAHRGVGIITPRGYVHHSFSEQLIELVRIGIGGQASRLDQSV